MASVSVRRPAKSASISVIVTRANGRVENLGTVSYWHRNALICWAMNFCIWIKERFRT